MAAENAPRAVDDVAGPGCLGAQPANRAGVVAVRHETDVLAVGLGGDGEAEALAVPADLVLGHVTERKAQVAELLGRGGEQEIALVARRVDGAVQLGPIGALDAANVVAGGQRIGAEIPGGPHQVAELDRLVAGDAGDRGQAQRVGLGEGLDHVAPEPGLVVQHVVRNIERVGDAARVMDVLAGAARARAPGRGTVVVELQRNADDLVALLGQQARRHR